MLKMESFKPEIILVTSEFGAGDMVFVSKCPPQHPELAKWGSGLGVGKIASQSGTQQWHIAPKYVRVIHADTKNLRYGLT